MTAFACALPNVAGKLWSLRTVGTIASAPSSIIIWLSRDSCLDRSNARVDRTSALSKGGPCHRTHAESAAIQRSAQAHVLEQIADFALRGEYTGDGIWSELCSGPLRLRQLHDVLWRF